MMKYVQIYVVLLVCALGAPCKGQNKAEPQRGGAPRSVTRNIIQDRKGDIWIAAFDGVFRYDGKSFTNVMVGVSQARFFSVLEDRKGNLWFGSVGSGAYRYDGVSFQHFTTKDGLINNEVLSMYEDRAGRIWFGVNGGASRYDGKSFRNYLISGDSMREDRTGKTYPDLTRRPHEVNAIVEDKSGKIWLATRDNSFIYDGKAFTTVIYNGKPFKNVRAIIEDKKGRLWLGGSDGLWRYEGGVFTNITLDFGGFIYEDKKGNIWTSSQSAGSGKWAVSRYDAMSLSGKKPIVTETFSHNDSGGMVFGILEAYDGTIWFGADGVYRYDGENVINAEGKKVGGKWSGQ